MFFRVKPSGAYRYLQLVENHREGRRTVQRVLLTLGRLDRLTAAGSTDALLRSLARFGQRVRLMEAGDLEKGPSQQLGPDLVFGRLWQSTGVQRALNGLLRERSFEFPVERAVYLTVLHRLFMSGSDRAAERWRRDVVIPGAEGLELHHLYRAMRWLGEAKDEVEEALFAGRRDLFTKLSLAFFDTTSLYFEGRGGESLGRYGHSKDHRPDLRQMVVGAVLTGDGRPVCCELWPGNHADGNALLPVVDRPACGGQARLRWTGPPAVDRLRQRFGLTRVCWVADRGMISRDTIQGLEARKLEYILGARLRWTGPPAVDRPACGGQARLRRQREVSRSVLARAGRYQEVTEHLRVKEVWVDGRRYIVCLNPDEAAKDAQEREAIVKALEDELRQGVRQLVGNRGYRRFLRVDKDAISIDMKKVAAEARYDGKFVLRTNTSLPPGEVAVQYKRLLLVERFFRAVKSILETRPIYHQWDATIRGHVFCSFLALVLLDELKRRLAARGLKLEWDLIRQDLQALDQARVREGNQWYLLRGPLQGIAGKALQAAGVAIPPPLRATGNVVPRP